VSVHQDILGIPVLANLGTPVCKGLLVVLAIPAFRGTVVPKVFLGTLVLDYLATQVM
jgi:hypothetical protein